MILPADWPNLVADGRRYRALCRTVYRVTKTAGLTIWGIDWFLIAGRVF